MKDIKKPKYSNNKSKFYKWNEGKEKEDIYLNIIDSTY